MSSNLNDLRKRASELTQRLAELTTKSPLPKPTKDIDKERELVTRYHAEVEARQRVASVVQAELADVQAEIATAEAEERKRRIAELNQQLTDGRAELVRRLQAAVDQAGHLHEVESAMYSAKNTVYHPTWPAFQQQLANNTFAAMNVELKR